MIGRITKATFTLFILFVDLAIDTYIDFTASIFRECRFRISQSIQSTGKLQLSGKSYDFTSEDLQDLGEIGRGGFGTVNKMVHRKSGTTMAVKRIRSTVDEKEQKQLLMDLEVVMKSNECPFIVQFYGALFKEVATVSYFILQTYAFIFREIVGFVWRLWIRL